MSLEQLKAEALKAAELALELAVEQPALNLALDEIVEALKKAIPGQLDDALLEMVKPQLKVLVKAELLKLIEQISPQV